MLRAAVVARSFAMEQCGAARFGGCRDNKLAEFVEQEDDDAAALAPPTLEIRSEGIKATRSTVVA